jgi:phosphotriesterase-related protein
MWPQYGGGYGHNYIIEKFVPRLKEEGVSEDAIYKILVENPKRQFAIA